MSNSLMKGRHYAVFILFCVVAMVGCRGKTDVNSNSIVESIRPMRIVTDDLDRRVTIPVKVTRAVSLAPNLTESIFAVGAGDRLVGVTTFCNYPEQAKEIAKIGDTMSPNMESIIALKPDVVFVSTASQIEAFMKTLEVNGIAVYVTNPTTLDGVLRNLNSLAEIFGTTDIARQTIAGLNDRLKVQRDKLVPESRTRVFVQISEEPLFTVGKDSFLNELIAVAGGVSVTNKVESPYPKLSKETASVLNPDVIILSESPDNQKPNEAFKGSAAMINGRVYKVNADLLSRPGPRLIDALELIAKDVNPDRAK